MKKIILLIIVFVFSNSIKSQDTLNDLRNKIISTINIKTQDTIKNWRKGGFGSVVFNQVSVTNWAAGGENALSSTAIISAFANYKKGNKAWDNSLDMAYGLMQTNNNPIRKNEGKLEINSKFGQKAGKNLYYTFLTNFKTQFQDGYIYPTDSTNKRVSRFMAPGYLTLSLGLDYKPSNNFSVFLSPATGKYTFVNDQELADLGSYGVDAAKYDENNIKTLNGKKFRSEFGAFLRSKFQMDIIKNVNFLTSLNLFNNYTDKNIINRKNIDVNWETLINIKANKYLTTSIYANLIYDHDIDIPTYQKVNGVKTITGKGPKTQFKESIGIGLSYKF